MTFQTFVKNSFFVIVLVTMFGCEPKVNLITMEGNTMGTTYHIKVVPNDKLPSQQKLQQQIDDALKTVNNQMSTYLIESELSQFNQLPIGKKIKVSPDTVDVIKEGIRLYHTTHGALDITLGPLVNLWGFGPDKRPSHIPTATEIAKAKEKTGIKGISIDGDTLQKLNKDLYVDLSSIAKGFGVDKVAQILNRYHVTGYMVEIGGEISTYGTKSNGTPWRIAVEQPTFDSRVVQQIIEPGTLSMATSGDYRNYYEENGQRFSHLIDPRTGYPIHHKLASVTVLNKSCMLADGYATAMMVLGVKDALALAKKEKLAIMLIAKEGNAFKVYYSKPFKKYLVPMEKVEQ